ncbi:mas-related G-protein coupled receptor member A4-like [Symphorus nematophorus]
MEDFYINITSQDKSYNYSNFTSKNDDYKYDVFIKTVVTYILLVVCLPLILLAIYALSTLVRKDHVAPIYVINLLITDLIQLCCMIVWVAPIEDWNIYQTVHFIYDFSLMVSVGFMVSISLERYLIIAHPLWYRCRRTIKSSVVVCIIVWALPLVILLTLYFLDNFKVSEIVFSVFLLLPLPLFMFFLGGTLKALSASRVPSDEKRRIVGVLVLVLLIYILLFLPSVIWLMAKAERNFTFKILSYIFLKSTPLADLTLYIFMRKGIIDKLLSSVCCCRMDRMDRMDSGDTTSSSV